MKSPYVNELKPNQLVADQLPVQSKEIRQKKGGDLYLSLMLADRTASSTPRCGTTCPTS